nr:YaaA family protein [Veillonella denticariosi]
MKIVLSPSKTKTISAHVEDICAQFHPQITASVLDHVKTLDVETLGGKALKLKGDKAAAVHDFYQRHEEYPVGGMPVRAMTASRLNI